MSVKLQEIFNLDDNLDRKNEYKVNDQRCPKGTVPILKQRNGTESVHLDTVEYPGQHVKLLLFIMHNKIILQFWSLTQLDSFLEQIKFDFPFCR